MSLQDPSLEYGRVEFPPNFRERAAALQVQLSAAKRTREGAGQFSQLGSGGDLVGYRPYRPGEDLRQLDWNLLARLNKPYVRVTRQEAGELWVIVLDASASMGAGPPGKWQRTAECAAALWSFAAHCRAEVRLILSAGSGEAPRVLEGSASPGIEAAMGFLADQEASGRAGLRSLFQLPRLFRGAARVFCIGDLLDQPMTELLGLRRSFGELRVLQLLAPLELDPGVGSMDWWDPESGERMQRQVGEADRECYRELLDGRLETWRTLAGNHRFSYHASSSAVEFEDLLGALFRR